MTRILTGIQSSGEPHLGNFLGAIKPGVDLSRNLDGDAFYFIADYHSLTSIKEAEARRRNTAAVAATWLVFAGDVPNIQLYRQSQIAEVTELAWILSCFTSYGLLNRSTSFKDKSDNLKEVNAGLFTYPVLMAADILLYDADIVPVGKDQKQHLEIAQSIAKAFNHTYGETFTVPRPKIDENSSLIPGIDGRKMSKSYQNAIYFLQAPAKIKKLVMSIVTDSKDRHDPKDPETCTIFKLYELVASAAAVEDMREAYVNGKIGYGDAKSRLLKVIVDTFEEPRLAYQNLMAKPDLLDDRLSSGETLVRSIAKEKILQVRDITGF